VIHVATVHFGSDRWIDIQLAYLQRHLHEPYRTVANLEGVPTGHDHKFDRVIDAKGDHPGKLNLIAAEITRDAAPDDLIMFMDGDAFPIADPMPTVHKALSESALIAVKRAENGADKQPHPCFCVIRVEEWGRLHGDWSAAYCWHNEWNWYRTDVGGNLLAALERSDSPWTPILRSNRINVHPWAFSVYGDIVYHHGAGFRKPNAMGDFYVWHPNRSRRAEAIPVIGWGVRKAYSARIRMYRTRSARRTARLSADIYRRIENDPEFFRDL
jgi:hypothetical protein